MNSALLNLLTPELLTLKLIRRVKGKRGMNDFYIASNS
jgi:hypothetical protein